MKGMKREYKIAYFSKAHERAIFRQSDDIVQWLSPEKIRTKEKKRAMRFISERDVEPAFISVKMSSEKWDLKTEEEYIDELLKESERKRPKQSWGEYSS